MVFVGDQRKNLLAQPRIGDQVGVSPRQVEVDVGKRFLDFVHDQPKQAEVAEHPREQRFAPAPPHVEKRREAGAQPIPPGDEVAVLCPGEHPGNGPQVGERPDAGAARGPGADVQERDLLDRARRLEVVHQTRVLHQPPVGRVGGSRQGLHRLVELRGGDERLLALGFERMLEHAGGEQLRLVGGGAAVRILERHHLPLLREAEPALDRAGGLGGDGAAGGRSAPAD